MKLVEQQVIISKISKNEIGYYFHVKEVGGDIRTYSQKSRDAIYTDWYKVLEDVVNISRYSSGKCSILFSEEFTEEDLKQECDVFSIGIENDFIPETWESPEEVKTIPIAIINKDGSVNWKGNYSPE